MAASVEEYARALSRNLGPVSLRALAGCLHEQEDDAILRETLRERQAFVWLDDDCQWFWCMEASGHELTYLATRKVLGVVGPVPVEKLQGAVLKAVRELEGLPTEAFTRYVVVHPAFNLVNGHVYFAHTPALGWADFLEADEYVVVRALQDLAGPSSVADIARAARGEGLGRRAILDVVYDSPVVEIRARGLYALLSTSSDRHTQEAEAVAEGRACALCRRLGPISLHAVAEAVQGEVGAGVVKSAVCRSRRLVWLDSDSGWLYLSGAPSGSAEATACACAKALAIAPGLLVGDLWRAISRKRNHHAATVPEDVLASYLELHQWFLVRDGTVNLAAGIPSRATCLTKTESQLVGLLQQFGPVCRRRDILLVARANGLRTRMIDLLLHTSPLVASPYRGLFCLLGTKVQASTLWDMVNRDTAPGK